MRGIGLSLAPLMLLASATSAAADVESAASVKRIGLAMSENRQPLMNATRGLLSDGAVLLAFANVASGDDTSITLQASKIANPVLDQAGEPEPLVWAASLPAQRPFDEGAEAREPRPLAEEEPCKLGLVCRESEAR